MYIGHSPTLSQWEFLNLQGFFQQLWEKAPGQNWEKIINLT